MLFGTRILFSGNNTPATQENRMSSIFEQDPAQLQTMLTSASISTTGLDGLHDFFVSKGETGALEDMAYSFLTSAGHSGSLSDMWSLAFDNGVLYGPELVAHGSFDIAEPWGLGTGVTVTGGEAVSNGTVGAFSTIVEQGSILTNGDVCTVKFDITEYTSGSIRISLGYNTNQTPVSAAGSVIYTATVDQNGSEGLVLRTPNSSFAGHLDNVSVRKVLST